MAGLAGDLVADGAVGLAHGLDAVTAYADQAGHCGHGYLDAQQIADHVVGCSRLGIQGGFHCIGDAALDAVAEGFARAAERVGDDAVRAARHRLEHCEMPSPDAIALFARLGVVASVQPMFDGLWGGPDGHVRRAAGRALGGHEPLRSARPGPGSCSPSARTRRSPSPEPWRAIQAAVHHHNPAFRMSPSVAFAAHTTGGWHAAGLDGGTLTVGGAGDVRRVGPPRGRRPRGPSGLPVLDPGADLPTCTRTVVDGRTVHTDPHYGESS